MTALAVTFGILILLALLRFGVSVEYCADGFTVAAKAGPLRLRLFPRKERAGDSEKKAARKARRAEKRAAKKARKEAKRKTKKRKKIKDGAEGKLEKRKLGTPGTILELLPLIKKALGRLRRKLLIKRLTIRYTAAFDDPSKTAQLYGAANAAIGVIVPVLENSFRIRRRDFRAAADFSDTHQSIYINAAISLAVWEAVYIIIALLPAIVGTKEKNNQKGGQMNGKESDKRPDGNDYAKSQGDDRRKHNYWRAHNDR